MVMTYGRGNHGISPTGPLGHAVPFSLLFILVIALFPGPIAEGGQVDTFDDGASTKEFRMTPVKENAYTNISVPANGHVISAAMWLEPSSWTDAGKVEHSKDLFKANMSSSSNLIVDENGISLMQGHELLQVPRSGGAGWSSGNHSLELAGLEELDNGSLASPLTGQLGFSMDMVVDASINSQDYPDMAVDKLGTRTSSGRTTVGSGGSITQKLFLTGPSCPP